MKIVIVFPYKFIDTYYRRYEIDFLMRYGDVLVWEMGKFLNPAFTKAISAASAEYNCVKRVDSWIDFFRALKALGSRGANRDRVVVLLHSQNTSFRALVCNLLIKLRADTIVDFSNSGVPPNVVPVNLGPRVLAKVARLMRVIRAREYTRAYRMLWSVWIRSVSRLFPLQPTHRLVAGRTMTERYSPESRKGSVQIVAGSTWDFSNSIAYQGGGDQPMVTGRYAVLLDGAGPSYASDVGLAGERPVLTSEKWYPALTTWFDQLERETGTKIVVAGHPKSTYPQNPEEFGFRQVYYDCTETLVRHAEFVITRASTAVSYAVMHHKPVLCIYSDQIRSNPAAFQEICNQSENLGVRPINLDAPPSCTDEYLKIPEEAYSRYKMNYLTSLSDLKPNYRVIAEEILGFNGAQCG